MEEITRVVVVGANGNLGAPVLASLVENGRFDVSVLRRASSKSRPSHEDKVNIIEVPDVWTFESLKNALNGQHAVVTCFPVKDVNQHMMLSQAAAAAGIKRFFPADWGSVDARSARARELVPLFERKVKIREDLERLTTEHAGFTWTSIVGGHFFDWGLRENFLHCDLRTHTADILDDGEKLSSLTTLAQYARAILRVLQMPQQTANKVLFIQSFCVSQNELLRSLEKATSVTWKIKRQDLGEFIKAHKIKADAGDLQAVEDLVFALGVEDGNWETKSEFAMDLLGLKEENLDAIVRAVVSSTKC